MSVVVHDDMPIDLALRLMWREATREGVLEKREELRYYVPKTTVRHQKRKVWEKTKRRRRSAARRARSK
jgi:ribosomal protein S21